MEGGRKMAIVPFKLWEDMKRWKEEQIQRPRLPPNPNVSATASLQRDLSSVMADDEMSEAEKAQLFGQTLHKFKSAHKKALEEQSLKLPSLTPSSSSRMNQLILDSVPSTMKRKAQLLLSILKDNPNMTWDDDGTVKLYGKAIQGSNVIDLVNDVLRHRKGSEPTGWQPFAEGLREMNIPQDVIGNRDRWDWMHRGVSSPRTPEFVTPAQKRISTARKRASRIPVSARSRITQRKIKEELSPASLTKIQKQLQSPKKLSATKSYIKEQLLSPKKETLFSPKGWLSFDEQ